MIKVKRVLQNQLERVEDFRYVDHKSILMPASKILIGTGNTLEDADIYESTVDLTMDLTFGATNLGLDTGTEAQDQWYAVYAVPGNNGSYGLRFSTNAPPQAGGAGPTGFTKYRYLGLVRNGGNAYDATNSNYGRGDIVRFTKTKNKTYYHGFHTTNGGAYPVAPYAQGINLYIANTATNNVMLNVDTATYIGLSGLSPNNTPKIPYRLGVFGFHMVVNPGASNSSATIYDNTVSNVINYFNASQPSNSTSILGVHFEYQFSPDTFSTAIRSETNNNANCSRGLWLEFYQDPYIVQTK